MNVKITACCFLLSLFFSSTFLMGQPSPSEIPPSYREDFIKARQYFYGYKNDSALVMWDAIIDQLEKENSVDAIFYIETKLRKAQSLEKAEQNEAALVLLIKLEKAARARGLNGILTEVHIALARLHEKINNAQSCQFHLKKAKGLIDAYSLEQYYPRFAVRTASYQRLFGKPDSAVFYAREAVRTAQIHGAKEEEASGNLLMGMMHSDQHLNKSVGYFQSAGEIWGEMENYVGKCAVYTNISSLLFKNNRLEEALLFNDTALVIANQLKTLGIIKPWPQSVNYLDRAKILKSMGNIDSAWYYMETGNELRVNEVFQTNHSKVLEMDAWYQNELKDQELDKKNQIIKFETNRRKGLIAGLSILLLLMAILSFLYFKLKAANNKVSRQSRLIQTSNQELQDALNVQLLLKSELHHRVKNNLQTVISILELQAEEVGDKELQNVLEKTTNRIFSIAAIHDLTMQGDDDNTVPFKDFVQKLCDYYVELVDAERTSFALDIPAVRFNIKQMMPLGLILNELITNALKHAFKKNNHLNVLVKLEKKGSDWQLTVQDNGGGFSNEAENKAGLGFHLIESMVLQLEGNLNRFNQNGATISISF